MNYSRNRVGKASSEILLIVTLSTRTLRRILLPLSFHIYTLTPEPAKMSQNTVVWVIGRSVSKSSCYLFKLL